MDLKITVTCSELIETLKVNRIKHEKDFLEASEGYRTAGLNWLEQQLDIFSKPWKIGRTPKLYSGLAQPSSFLPQYDQALEMVTMHQRSGTTTLELSPQDYQALVKDAWQWKGAFIASSSQYLPNPGNPQEDL